MRKALYPALLISSGTFFLTCINLLSRSGEFYECRAVNKIMDYIYVSKCMWKILQGEKKWCEEIMREKKIVRGNIMQ